MRRRIFTALVALAMLLVGYDAAAQDNRPKLVVNIVVGSMRATDLERYADGFGESGFKRLMREGVNFTDAEYDYALTSTEAGLATFATGAQPSVHGVIGRSWWNHTDGSRHDVIADKKSHPIPFSTGAISCSPNRLQAPTLGDMVVDGIEGGKQITIAIEPYSAIVMNGRRGVAYWVERNKTQWTTCSAYTGSLPEWVARYNSDGANAFYRIERWEPNGNILKYRNSEVAVVEGIKGKTTKLLSDVNLDLDNSAYGHMCYTPAGNTMLLEFASQAVAQEKLGADTATDVLNICLDTPRYIAETYGPESIEYEDMLYRLDATLAEFLTYIYAQVGGKDNVIVVLTSDHGTAPSYNPQGGAQRERFNNRQMEVIVNAFLGAHHGPGDYLLGFANNALYLNHELILEKKLSLEDIQEEVATFLLQLRGVSTAISATALRNTSFGEGRMRLVQQSFFATRSGDVIINLMPGWIIEKEAVRSASGSMYRYDTHVPLIIYGGGLAAKKHTEKVDITSLATTQAQILSVSPPSAAEGEPLTIF